MAEGYEPIPKKSPVWYYQEQTGITGVQASKCGYIVQLFIDRNISVSSSGWQDIGTLPEELRPWGVTQCSLYDNNAPSSATNTIVDLRVMTNGHINIYAFGDKLQFQALGSVTFITNHG